MPIPIKPVFPFAAIAGKHQLKKALVLCAIDPGLGGVLVLGREDPALFSMVESVADLLPEIKIITQCPWGCAPGFPQRDCPFHHHGPEATASHTLRKVRVVRAGPESTETQVAGSVDFARTASHRGCAFEPGLLAMANRGFLFLDAPDRMERSTLYRVLASHKKGIHKITTRDSAITHSTRFVLVCRVEPDNLSVLPGFRKSFRLVAALSDDPQSLAEQIEKERRLAFQKDPAGFIDLWKNDGDAIAEQIRNARTLLPWTEFTTREKCLAVRLCKSYKCRQCPESLALERAARATAAWNGRIHIMEEDIKKAAALTHGPFPKASAGKKGKKSSRPPQLSQNMASKRTSPENTLSSSLSPEGEITY